MNYFNYDIDKQSYELLMEVRAKRKFNLLSSNHGYIAAGDILSIAFWKEARAYKFEGICLAIKKKSLNLLNTTIILRNVIFRVGIEVTVSFFLHHMYSARILDFRRKQFLYKKVRSIICGID
jgi:ribosomal protein L19